MTGKQQHRDRTTQAPPTPLQAAQIAGSATLHLADSSLQARVRAEHSAPYQPAHEPQASIEGIRKSVWRFQEGGVITQ